MKNPLALRRVGLALVILASLGLLFSLVGVIGVWVIRPRAQSSLMNTVNILQGTLTTTDDGIKVLDSTLEDSKSNLTMLVESLEKLGTTLSDVSVSLETSGTLVGDDLRQTVIETQIALTSAAGGAKIIDDTLSVLSAIPLLGVDYQPEVPLNTSLSQVADSLDEIPDSLETLESQLSTTATGLDSFSDDLAVLSDNMALYNTDLEDAQATLQDYRIIIEDSLNQVDNLKSNLNKILIYTSIFLSGVLLWLGVAQVNVLIQGWGYMHHEQKVVNLADLTRE